MYQRHDYLREREAELRLWAQHVLEAAKPSPASATEADKQMVDSVSD